MKRYKNGKVTFSGAEIKEALGIKDPEVPTGVPVRMRQSHFSPSGRWHDADHKDRLETVCGRSTAGMNEVVLADASIAKVPRCKRCAAKDSK